MPPPTASWRPCSTPLSEAGEAAVERHAGDARGAAPQPVWSTPARPGWSSSTRGAVAGLRGEAVGPAGPAVARPVTIGTHHHEDSPSTGTARPTWWRARGVDADALASAARTARRLAAWSSASHRCSRCTSIRTTPAPRSSLAVAVGSVDRDRDRRHAPADRRARAAAVAGARPPGHRGGGRGGRQGQRGRLSRGGRPGAGGRRPVDEPVGQRDRGGDRGGRTPRACWCCRTTPT